MCSTEAHYGYQKNFIRTVFLDFQTKYMKNVKNMA